MKRLPLFLLAVTLLLIAAGCAPAPAVKAGGASVIGVTVQETAAGADQVFTVPAQPGDQLGIDFRGTLNQGSLRLELLDPAGQVVWQSENQTAVFAVDDTLTLDQAGDYHLRTAWDGPVQGRYDLIWRPGPVEVPSISPIALIDGAGMIAVGLGFLAWALRGRRLWRYAFLGGLFWLITVALKLAFASAVNQTIYNELLYGLGKIPGSLIFYLYVGALTGVFEVGLTYAVLRVSKLGKADWAHALAFGAGFGVIEAFLLGISPLAAVIAALTSPDTLSVQVLHQLARLNDFLYAILPVWERFFTIWVHIFANVLLFYAVITRQKRWVWLSFGFKTLFDSVAAYAQISGITTLGFLWTIEAVVAAFGLAGWWGVTKLKRMYLTVERIASGE